MEQYKLRKQVLLSADYHKAFELIGLKLGIANKAYVVYKSIEFIDNLIDQIDVGSTLSIRSKEGNTWPVSPGVFMGLTSASLSFDNNTKLGLWLTEKQERTVETLIARLHFLYVPDCFRYIANVMLALIEHTNEGDAVVNEEGQVVLQL